MLIPTYKTPPRRQRRYLDVVEYCRAVHERTGQAPSYSMISDALGINYPGTVRRYVHQAADAGLISLAPTTGGRGPRRGERIKMETAAEHIASRESCVIAD
jgi:hypothetical protein